jgi:hypothetical protein
MAMGSAEGTAPVTAAAGPEAAAVASWVGVMGRVAGKQVTCHKSRSALGCGTFWCWSLSVLTLLLLLLLL